MYVLFINYVLFIIIFIYIINLAVYYSVLAFHFHSLPLAKGKFFSKTS